MEEIFYCKCGNQIDPNEIPTRYAIDAGEMFCDFCILHQEIIDLDNQ